MKYEAQIHVEIEAASSEAAYELALEAVRHSLAAYIPSVSAAPLDPIAHVTVADLVLIKNSEGEVTWN